GIFTSSGNVFGGTAAGTANTIAFNGGAGAIVASGTGNAFPGNQIFSNAALGIDLGNDGVTANDANDADTGANNLQNFPLLTLASTAGGNTTVTGTLNSTASTTFRVEFFSNAACDASGNGEGRTFLGFQNVTTDGAGNATVNATLPAVTVGEVVTATATDPANNTSEFSACQVVTAPPLVCTPPPANMAAWYPGDGNADDIEGGNDGTLQNGATFAAGKVGQAFSFDGVDDQVVFPHNTNQNGGTQITVDAWVNLTSSGHGRPIAQKRSSSNIGGYTFETTHSPFGPDNGLSWVITIGGTQRTLQTPANVLTLGAFQHVAATYDGATMRIFVDGVEKASLAMTGTIDPVADPLVTGRNVVNTSFAWNGLIDELELFNRALTQAEIQSIFNASTAGKCKPSVDLSITKTDSPDPVVAGNNLTYAITATNNGPDAATGVAVTDALPAGVTFVSATPSQGACSGTSTVNCALGSLANGASATVSIVVTASTAGTLTNTATVTGIRPDPSAANNSATATTTVSAPAPTFSINGRVTNASAVGVPGVLVTLSGSQAATTNTDANGDYSFASLAQGGNFTITPSLAGFTFTPSSRTFNNLQANQTGADFTTNAVTHTLTGRVADGVGQGLLGINLTLSGTQSAVTTTDAAGPPSRAPTSRATSSSPKCPPTGASTSRPRRRASSSPRAVRTSPTSMRTSSSRPSGQCSRRRRRRPTRATISAATRLTSSAGALAS
ncbi:MAG: DUF11 domain-containing protein, partial [Acidobacteria bacterium]|nr:DUF11 domain-containing protein [Acidobacteriota bacterium]